MQSRIKDPGSQSRSPRTVWITLIVLLTIALGLCLLMVWPFAATIIGAGVLAVVLYPLHQKLHGRVTKPGLAALLSTILVVIAFLVPLILLATTVTQELRAAYSSLAPSAGEPGASRIWAAIDRPLAIVATRLGMQPSELRSLLEAKLQQAGSAILGKTGALLGAAGGGVVKLIIGIGTLYCAFLYGSRLYKNAVALSPLGKRRTVLLFTAVHEVVMASFYGVVAVAAAQGLLCGLGAWIAGLPSPTLWGVAAAAFSVLPLFGSALVWLPAAAVLFIQGSIGRGIFMLAWGAGLVGTIDNIIRPMVIVTKLPVHPLVVFVTMLGGVEAFGLMGILFGPVILALTIALFRMLREEMSGGEPG